MAYLGKKVGRENVAVENITVSVQRAESFEDLVADVNVSEDQTVTA